MPHNEQQIALIQKIHDAIFGNQIDTLKQLVRQLNKEGINIDDAIYLGITPLLRAISLDQVAIINYLLRIGSDVNRATKPNKSAISFAKKIEIKKILLEHIIAKAIANYKENPTIRRLIDELDDTELFIIDPQDIEHLTNIDVYNILYCALVTEDKNLFIYFFKQFSSIAITNFSFSDHVHRAVSSNIQQLVENNEITIKPIIEQIAPDHDCMYNAILRGYHQIYPQTDIAMEVLRNGVSLYLGNADMDELIVSQLLNNVLISDLAGLPESIAIQLAGLIDLHAQGIEDANIADLIREYNLPALYREAVAIRGTWGDNIELGIISELLNVIIMIHNPNGTRITINNAQTANPQIIELEYNGAHYNVITGYIIEEPNIESISSEYAKIIPVDQSELSQNLIITKTNSTAENTISKFSYTNVQIFVCCACAVVGLAISFYNEDQSSW